MVILLLKFIILGEVEVDNATSIGEAVSKTERLQGKLRKLEKQKLERLQGLAISSSEAPLSSSTAFPSSISKNPSSRDAFLGVGKGSSSNSGVAVEAPNIVNSSVDRASDQSTTEATAQVEEIYMQAAMELASLI
ncbi:hypothetical protein Q3G72_031360 [Acer saccharum]|nr:hypothetical protein Q3G72_031360 [Acer saccharum]